MKQLMDFFAQDTNVRFLNKDGAAHYANHAARTKDFVLIFTERSPNGALFTQEAAELYKGAYPYAYFTLIDPSTAALLYDNVVTVEDIKDMYVDAK